MIAKDNTMFNFYQLLGRVFYAAAQADKVIRQEEVLELKRIVTEVWLDVDDSTDEFNTDAAFQIEIAFDYLLNNDAVIDGVINELKTFKSIHASIFSAEMNALILATASKIISSFAKKNKAELVFFNQLEHALND